MTFAQLKQKYLEYSQSTNVSDRMRAKGYAQIIKKFSYSNTLEYFEEVRVSLVAESYLSTAKMLYNVTHKKEYQWHIKAAMDCIISYANDTELAALIYSQYKGDIEESKIFQFLNETPYKGRVKYNSVHSLCDVINLPVGDKIESSEENS